MKASRKHEEKIEKQFDSFCKKVLRNYARDIYLEKSRKYRGLISIDLLNYNDMNKFTFTENYDVDNIHISLGSLNYKVDNEIIGNAIDIFSETEKKLLYYNFFK
ncbi:hypothetical protein KQI89_12755 [Clostridium sp. MSJ-4]|uniref:Uncharacterized protein n=1 Tax=Clostridium simiarum TaxID=2841506 RepID=A0ABS6F507_9CLOT|nr:hypothetical protein [Clostridium simiarum]MBU5592627.1 hypothetical protein [Clostridium simiarum]